MKLKIICNGNFQIQFISYLDQIEVERALFLYCIK